MGLLPSMYELLRNTSSNHNLLLYFRIFFGALFWYMAIIHFGSLSLEGYVVDIVLIFLERPVGSQRDQYTIPEL